MTAVLETRGLRKAFGHQQVLDGVDLAVDQGESLVVIGQSGTGKSVLLKCILGLEAPDAGQVRWLGQPLTRANRAAFLDGFGMLF
ncbi:ATP-binding cassette domain-containing protein, partial [Acinetobacter baumannii]|nr:ATP-binding cassette domain-containing protein [Acinetobacter baumannii]